ncbi:uncharacterized protein LOC129744360 [Uranotaenia lowii]|uniref:uncharacterized protein LOC129744360 n=1 Tax=Uranotaenia lowii TaxID=190385 RepID=UPI002479E358|nr:uncharacterized protein LOC129744360 [Uranotaenia lowii]XP_055592820.1 uncharacterized protein LOC129744360 [Uranotaenia lowii]
MVSTRQMTGATTEESTLYLFRSSVNNSNSSASSSPSHQPQQLQNHQQQPTALNRSISSSSGAGSNIAQSVTSQNGHSSPQHVPNINGVVSLPQQPQIHHQNQYQMVPVGGVAGGSSSHATFSGNGSGGVGGYSTKVVVVYSNGDPSQNQHYVTQTKQQQRLNLMDLPVEILEHIFSYTGYRKVAQMRTISHQMNQVCSSILNSTFQKLQTQMLNRFQIVKAKMPRRESARRNHPLACECDILETCSMRLSLLQMTFGKHIERKHCCFFPGGILDEVYSVLKYIRSTPILARPFKVTDELFDLSTMAMEYFKEHIEPNLPDITYFNKDYTSSTKPFAALEVSSSILSRDTSHSSSSSPPQSNMVLRKGIRKIKQGMKRYNNQLSVLRSELRTCKRKATEQAKQIAEQQKLLAEQQKQTLEYANRLDENDKKNEEISRKFSTLLQELNKCKTELQYWRSKSPATPNCSACGQAIVAMPPEDLQALVNQGVRPEEVGLAVIPEEPANLEELEAAEVQNAIALELDAQPLSPIPVVGQPAATIGSPRSGQKRKFDCVEAGNGDDVSGSPTRSTSPLSPPFVSAQLASLVASYSSAGTAGPSTSYGSTGGSDPSPSSVDGGAGGSSPAADAGCLFPPYASSSSLSNPPSPSDAATNQTNGSSSSDSSNHKKLRRVQNKARSQINHNNGTSVSNTNTKATRSKQLEK